MVAKGLTVISSCVVEFATSGQPRTTQSNSLLRETFSEFDLEFYLNQLVAPFQKQDSSGSIAPPALS